jgi:flagellar hook-basal body complex protein FliE
MAMPLINSQIARLEMPLTASLQAQAQRGQLSAAGLAAPDASLDFGSLLGQSVSEVNSLQQQSTASVHDLLTGGDVQPAEVFASVQKADMAFRMLLQVRNKLMQAYEEVNAIRI